MPARIHVDVVDPDPLVLAVRVRREHPHLDERLVVRRRGQRRLHGRDERRRARTGRRVRHECRRERREVTRLTDSVLQRHRLRGVRDRGGIDVAQAVANRHTRASARVERQHQMGRGGGRRALQRHHRVGEVELRHARRKPHGQRIGLVGVDVDRRAGAVRHHEPRIRPGGGGQPVAAVAHHSRDARPVVVALDQAGVAPSLREGKGDHRREGVPTDLGKSVHAG
jgi:hypothetical protein